MPESTSHAAAGHKVEQNKDGHSHHGAEKQASDKPAHEFGATGKSQLTSELDRTDVRLILQLSGEKLFLYVDFFNRSL